MIFVHERERRTGHIFTNSSATTDGLRQRRFAGAEVALETDDRAALQASTKRLTPCLQLIQGDSCLVTRRRLWPLASGLWPLPTGLWARRRHFDARIAAKASRLRGVASRFA